MPPCAKLGRIPELSTSSTSHVSFYLRYQRGSGDGCGAVRKLRFVVVSRDLENGLKIRRDGEDWKLRGGEVCEWCSRIDFDRIEETWKQESSRKCESIQMKILVANIMEIGMIKVLWGREEGGLVSIILRKCWTFGLASMALCSFVWNGIGTVCFENRWINFRNVFYSFWRFAIDCATATCLCQYYVRIRAKDIGNSRKNREKRFKIPLF